MNKYSDDKNPWVCKNCKHSGESLFCDEHYEQCGIYEDIWQHGYEQALADVEEVGVRPIKHYSTCIECTKDVCADQQNAGMLADLCDILFDDPDRALNYGYEGVIEQAKKIMRHVQLGFKT